MQAERSTNCCSRPDLWFYGIFACALIVRVAAFAGIVGADDVSIAANAVQVLEDGPTLPEGHYAARVGLIYPLAIIFSLVGIGEWQMVAMPFVASLIGVFLAYYIASRAVSQRAGLIASALIAFFPLDVSNASLLVPDLPLGVALAASFAFALHMLTAKKPFLWAILAGLVWGYAWLIKVEAFFMAFVYAGLLWQYKSSWRQIIAIFVVAGAVVFVENLIYWTAGGELLHRLHAALNQGDGKFTEEFSQTSLWVYPKAWFVTFYQFGLHYYGLAVGLLWVAVRRSRATLAIRIWVVVYLLWLQFGGNPFAEEYSVKSHLLRYCVIVTIPMAIVVASMLDDLWDRGRASIAVSLLGVFLVVGGFFVNFNTLSYEREVATKKALDIAVEHEYFPLYLDRTSEALASFYLTDERYRSRLFPLQDHDFRTQETKVLDIENIKGYVLLNRGFMEYAWNRYRMDKVMQEALDSKFHVASVINNPGNKLAYEQVKLFVGLAQWIPNKTLRQKITDTGNGILRDGDVVLMEPIDNRE